MEQPSYHSDSPPPIPATPPPAAPAGPTFDNPPVAEGINAPERHPVRSCFVNLIIVAAALAAFALFMSFAANHFTQYIPFSWEKAAVGNEFLQSRLDAHGQAKQDELRRLAARLSGAMDMPAGVDVTVFYNPGDMVNAFATFGGNIIVFQGLLDLVGSEDELAMVLAHEIAHVKHRDSIKGVVRAAGFVLLGIGIQDSAVFMDKVTNWEMAGYGRKQEEDADLDAMRALAKVYGHARGAREFFESLAVKVEKREVTSRSEQGGLGASHPDTLRRLRTVEAEAGRLGVAMEGTLTPMAEALDSESLWFGGK